MRSFLISLLLFASFSLAQTGEAEKNKVKKAEIQFEICEPSVGVILKKLQLSASSTKTKEVFYHDTDNLDLIRQNVVLKISSASSKLQSIAKVKNLSEDSIPWNELENHDHKCELDIYLDLSRISCSLSEVLKNNTDILSLPQVNFIKATGLNPIYPNMKSFGPVATLSQTVKDSKYNMVIESSFVGRKLAAIEFSVRTDIKDARKAQTELKYLLDEAGVILCSDQQGKIKRIFDLLKSEH